MKSKLRKTIRAMTAACQMKVSSKWKCLRHQPWRYSELHKALAVNAEHTSGSSRRTHSKAVPAVSAWVTEMDHKMVAKTRWRW